MLKLPIGGGRKLFDGQRGCDFSKRYLAERGVYVEGPRSCVTHWIELRYETSAFRKKWWQVQVNSEMGVDRRQSVGHLSKAMRYFCNIYLG